MKQVKIFFSGLIIILLLITCNSVNVQFIQIEINPTSQPKGSLTLSELVEQVEYIPLETNDNCIVGDITGFDVTENYIAVFSRLGGYVFLFERNGRFIAEIGRKGQGPAEYLMPNGVLIDELKKCVYVKDFVKLLVYDFSGKHLNSFSLDERVNSINIFCNNQFISGKYSNQSNEDYYVFGIWDSNMNLIKQGVKGVPLIIKSEFGASFVSIGPELSYYIYQGHPHLKESVLNDTVYLLNSKNEFIPKYVINCGRYTMTAEDKGDLDNFRSKKESGKFIGGVSVFESSDFIFQSYYFVNKWIPCYFDKKENKLLYFNSEEGIPDDYTGGIDFWPTLQKNNEMYCFQNSYNLLDKYAKQKKITPKGPSTSVQKVQSLLKTLYTEDNPVLIIAKMKE